jgi:hypothetical protein
MSRNDRIVFLDVENTAMTVEKKVYDLFQRGGHSFRYTDIKAPRRLFSFQAKPLGKKPIWHSAITEDDYEPMIRHLHEVMSNADVIVGWNSQNFDMTKARHAFFLLGLPRIPDPFQVDLMKVARKYFDFESNSLGYVSSVLVPDFAKIALDTPIEVLISQIRAGSKSALATLKKYGLRDVTVLEAMWPQFLPYVKLPHARPADAMLEDGDLICPTCGGVDTISRGSAVTVQGRYPRRSCNTCGSWYQVTRSTVLAKTRAL